MTDIPIDNPLANTKAARMLAKAFDKISDEKNLSRREIAKMMGYKGSVVLSHLTLGRAPIPLDRTLDFCRILGLDRREFTLAVLEQRHPEIPFSDIFDAKDAARKSGKSGDQSNDSVIQDLEIVAGMPLHDLPSSTYSLIREVLSDTNPRRRWASIDEISILEMIRKTNQGNLSFEKRQKLKEILETL